MTTRVAFGLWLAFLMAITVFLTGCGDDDDDAAGGDADDDADDDTADDDAADDDADDDATDDDADDDDNDDDDFTCDSDNEDSTVGLLYCQTGAFEGYTLLAPTMVTTVYLIDMFGRVVNEWDGDYLPGQVVYLLESGQLLRTGNTLNLNFTSGGQGGMVILQEWDGAVTWSYRYSTNDHCSHHDVKMLPSGNVLLIAWEKKTQAEAIQAGRNPSHLAQNALWPDSIIEVEPVGDDGGNIVWEWHAWDHLIQDYDAAKDNYGVVDDHPELIDINYVSTGQADFMHTNSVDYNEEFDQILVSVHEYNEVWVIDHSTTTAEAAGHTGGDRGQGGDLLYRWGNPATYGGTSADRFFYYQHDGQWIESGLPGAGNMMVFNNGAQRPSGQYSTVDEWVPAVDAGGDYAAPSPFYGPDDLTWSYQADTPTDFFSHNISGAQRLANGNTLICSGDRGTLFEVNAEGETLWMYINPVTEHGILEQGDPLPPGVGGAGNMMFRAYRYAPDYAGLAGQDLTPGECLVEPCE
jgi:hypothetical protein